ncbi:MAG: hypothetical protein GC134_08720 [Proteobacteria bacterium]|nr:hypothetical protein [Pseudomonadota bacterium]
MKLVFYALFAFALNAPASVAAQTSAPASVEASTTDTAPTSPDTQALMATWQTMLDAAGPLPPRPGDYSDNPAILPEERLRNLRALAEKFDQNVSISTLEEPYRFLVTRFTSAGAMEDAEEWANRYLHKTPDNTPITGEILYRLAVGFHQKREEQRALNWLIVAEDKVINGEDVQVNFYRTEKMSVMIAGTYKEIGQDTLAFDWDRRFTQNRRAGEIDAAMKEWDTKKNVTSALNLAELYKKHGNTTRYNDWRRKASEVIRADWAERIKTAPGLIAEDARALSNAYEADNPAAAKQWRDYVVALVAEQQALDERNMYKAQEEQLTKEWEDFKNPFAALHLAIAFSRDDPEKFKRWREITHKRVSENYKRIKPQEMLILCKRLSELYKKDNPKMAETWENMIPAYQKQVEREQVTGVPGAK